MDKVAIIGAGESGVGAAILAHKKGYEVFVSEYGQISEYYKNELISHNILFEEGGHNFEKLSEFNLFVKSPGIPDSSPVIQWVLSRNLSVISEIEWGSMFYSGTIVAVTGSNGKTTTSGLLYHMLKVAGKDVALGGNYGKSFARILAESDPEFMVLEVSSFQLDNISHFKPSVAILLNITPDHLDRYDYNLEKYADAKMRIGENQDESDIFIYNADDPVVAKALESHSMQSKMIPIRENDYINGISSKDGKIFFDISIQGRHNLFNARCCVEACRCLGVSESAIAEGLKSFVNLPHRLEVCLVMDKITFINDSKATNTDAVYFALEAMKSPVVWIAGGTDKGNDYSVLMPLVREKVKALVCLGLDNQKLLDSFSHVVPVSETTKMSEAVQNAMDLASEGDIVLLSPACASFDLFKNYMDRGEQFKSEVLKLKNNKNKH